MLFLEKLLSQIIGGTILIVMMVLVSADVLGRYTCNAPLQGTNEVVEFLMVGLFYFTVSHAQALRTHIRVEFLLTYLSPRLRIKLEILCHLLGLLIFTLIAWQSWRAALQAWKLGETTFGVILFPLFPAKILVPLGSFLFCLRLGKDIWDDWHKLKE
ncbi:MAG: TRAP transporter small permease subunit [bacterium]